MILTVEYPYSACLILKRGRTAKDYFLRGRTDVKIEEIPSDDAPVALRMKCSRNDRARIIEMRWWDNCLWEPYFFRKDSSDSHLSAAALREHVSQNKRYGNPLAVGQDWHLDRSQRIEEIDVRQIVDSTRDKVAAHLEAIAAGLISIDGMLFQKGDEPVYVITSGYRYTALTVDSVGGVGDSRNPDMVYRADRWDDARAKCRELGGDDNLASEDDSPEDGALIEVIMPEVLRYDDERPALMHAAKYAIDRMGSHLKRATRGFMLAYADLRDAVEESRPVDPDLVDAMTAAAAECEKDDALEGESKSLNAAVERWRMRPVSVEEADAVSYPGLGQI